MKKYRHRNYFLGDGLKKMQTIDSEGKVREMITHGYYGYNRYYDETANGSSFLKESNEFIDRYYIRPTFYNNDSL